MKPLKLAIENFGPYAKRAEIDFTKLGDFFLVCGKTGSGKTTIFDAISYALYGSPSGSRNSCVNELYSQHAAPGSKPLVEFEFLLEGRKWLASRRPSYPTVGKRTGELRNTPPEATLYEYREGGWKLLSDKVFEVNETIVSRIGLTADEFSKIILLPQGEFQAFLEMKSTERTKVLEKLFPVDVHGRIAELSRRKLLEAENSLRGLDQRLSSLPFDPDSAEAELASRAKSVCEIEAELKAAGSAVAAKMHELESAEELALRFVKFAEAQESLKKLEEMEPKIEEMRVRERRARSALRATPHVEARERAEAEALLERRRREDLAAEFSRLEARTEEIGKLKAGIAETKSVLDGFSRREGELAVAVSAWEKMEGARAEWAESRKADDSALENLEIKTSILAAVKGKESLLAVSPSLFESSAKILKETRDEFEAAKDAAKKSADKEELEQKRKMLARESAATAGELAGTAASVTERELAVQKAEEAKESSLSALLASRLVEGKPCPVCGSPIHPLPAAAPSDAERIENLLASEKLKLEKARRSLHELESRENSYSERIKEIVEAISSIGENVLDPEEAGRRFLSAESKAKEAERTGMEISKRAEEGEKLKFEAEKAERELHDAREAKSAASRKLAETETRLLEVKGQSGPGDPRKELGTEREKKRKLEEELARVEADIRSYETSITGLSASLAARTENLSKLEAESARTRENERIAFAEEGFLRVEDCKAAFLEKPALESLERERGETEKALEHARIVFRTAREAVEGKAEPDTESLRIGLEALKTRLDETEAKSRDNRYRMEQLSRLKEERVKLSEERARLSEDSGRLKQLSDLLNGTFGDKLPFKNFVLSMYFELVAVQASVRLMEMSDGRYSLSVGGKSRGSSGLELTIHDSFTGYSRSTGTLSGGEKFLTSVSLALGLADVIQRRSGGISLDAVFIDEGFGSLDEETLDKALAVLDRIRGNRTVGIVSHVGELKARIPSRIEVTKERNGSLLRIVT